MEENNLKHSREALDTPQTIAYAFVAEQGVNEAVVRRIWEENHEPEWMLTHRLKCLEIFKTKQLPTWGPDLSGLKLDEIYYYAKTE